MKSVLTDLNLEGVGRVKNSLDAIDLQDCVTLAQHNLKADKTTTITGTNGLTGGGDLSANRQISMQYPELIYNTTANQTSTSATFANVTQLTTGSLSTGLYLFDAIAICQSTNAPTGLSLRLGSVTATLSTCVGKWFISQNSNGNNLNYQYDQLTSTTNVVPISSPSANVDFLVTGAGLFRVTAAGTVAVQIRSESTTAVSIRADSILKIKRVS